tara:strand:+ start:57 stop:245 length:189 start_codon:yes stop_codon:yes gene_type:complete
MSNNTGTNKPFQETIKDFNPFKNIKRSRDLWRKKGAKLKSVKKIDKWFEDKLPGRKSKKKGY